MYCLGLGMRLGTIYSVMSSVKGAVTKKSRKCDGHHYKPHPMANFMRSSVHVHVCVATLLNVLVTRANTNLIRLLFLCSCVESSNAWSKTRCNQHCHRICERVSVAGDYITASSASKYTWKNRTFCP